MRRPDLDSFRMLAGSRSDARVALVEAAFQAFASGDEDAVFSPSSGQLYVNGCWLAAERRPAAADDEMPLDEPLLAALVSFSVLRWLSYPEQSTAREIDARIKRLAKIERRHKLAAGTALRTRAFFLEHMQPLELAAGELPSSAAFRNRLAWAQIAERADGGLFRVEVTTPPVPSTPFLTLSDRLTFGPLFGGRAGLGVPFTISARQAAEELFVSSLYAAELPSNRVNQPYEPPAKTDEIVSRWSDLLEQIPGAPPMRALRDRAAVLVHATAAAAELVEQGCEQLAVAELLAGLLRQAGVPARCFPFGDDGQIAIPGRTVVVAGDQPDPNWGYDDRSFFLGAQPDPQAVRGALRQLQTDVPPGPQAAAALVRLQDCGERLGLDFTRAASNVIGSGSPLGA